MPKSLILFFLLYTFSSFAIDCEKAYQKHLQSDLTLSYQEFDQTMDSGFRPLAKLGCKKQAADLIEQYILHNNADQNSLKWHVAQLRAFTGNYISAIKNANLVLSEKEDFSKKALRWNDYVLATIAFLEKDKAKLIEHRNNVAAAKNEHYGNEMNMKLLDALIEHFDESYQYAMNTPIKKDANK